MRWAVNSGDSVRTVGGDSAGAGAGATCIGRAGSGSWGVGIDANRV